jgi:integrase
VRRSIRDNSFANLLKRALLPPMRFHALRHGAATALIASGVPVRVVSEQLGHANIGITLQTYSHVLETMQDTAADAVDKLFGKVDAK